MKTFLPVQSTNKHLILKKLDNQILTEERIDNYAITKPPNETIKMILVDTEMPLKIQQKHMLYCHRPARDLTTY